MWPWQKSIGATQDELLDEVIIAIGQLTSRSVGNLPAPIRPEDHLGSDLGLSSVAVARLAGILQKKCGRGPLPFYQLFVKPDGTLLQDIRVRDVAEFLMRSLHAETP